MSKKDVVDNEKNETTESKSPTDTVEEVKEESNIVEVKEKVKEELKKENNNNKKLLFIIIGIVLIITIIFGIFKVLSNINGENDDIKSVKRVLKEKYIIVECIDSKCSGIVAIKGDKLKKTTIELYNKDGKKVASYSEIYDGNKNEVNIPNQISNNYFIMKRVKLDDYKALKYSINNKKGKEVYSTSNELSVLTDKYILMEEEKNGDEVYTILNSKGKVVYSDIKDIDTYGNNEYIAIEVSGEYIVLDNNMNKVLNGYDISREVKNKEGKLLYLIVKDKKNDIYYYYNIKKSEIKGDGFISYTSVGASDNELIINKKENDKNVKYKLKADGTQKKIKESNSLSEVVNKLKEKIDTDKYSLYSESIIKENQKNILVDSKEEKALGILNLETNKFTPLYSYRQDKSYFYSSVSKLNTDNKDLYLKISCSSYTCDTKKTIIYDFKHSKEIYRSESSDLQVLNYIQYEGDYKVIKYSYSSINKDYSGKYVLYDKDNKELLKSKRQIIIIDKEIVFGDVSSSSLVLYSVKKSKLLNSEENTASVINVNDNKLYKYTSNDGKSVIIDLNGKEVISVDGDGYISYSGSNIIYLKDNTISIYNVKTGKIKEYELKENEKMNDASGDIVSPYRGIIYVNNSSDKYIKILNSNGKVIKKIKNVELISVENSKYSKNSYIIVKKSTKNGDLYGLYIAK